MAQFHYRLEIERLRVPWGAVRSSIWRFVETYGFAKPYDFARAFPFLTATVLLLVTTTISADLAASGKLSWGTWRHAYYLYVGLVAFAAAALSYRPRIAWALIALGFVELSVGTGSALLVRMQFLKHSVLPADKLTYTWQEGSQFRYHPLLQATLKPNYLRLTPFRIHHDSQGLRGEERDAARLRHQIVIATVGGSTTFDIGVPNGQTWSDDLERDLGGSYAVLNHGVPGYTTVEHVIQTVFYLDAYGIRPNCAVYYVGWNDIRNAHLPNLDPAYADFHLLSQVGNFRIREAPSPLLSRLSPLVKLAMAYYQAWRNTQEIIPMPPDYSGLPAQGGSDVRLEEIFRRNLETIATVNKQRGTTSIFVGQVLNRARLGTDMRSDWHPLVRYADEWPLQSRFNTILERTSERLGAPAYIPPVEAFREADFVDDGHFSTQGAAKLASMLAPTVRANCR